LLDDEAITDKALHFAQICECPEVAKTFMTQEWLDMFKGKIAVGRGPSEGPIGPRNGTFQATPPQKE
jgi:hypothetical protein